VSNRARGCAASLQSAIRSSRKQPRRLDSRFVISPFSFELGPTWRLKSGSPPLTRRASPEKQALARQAGHKVVLDKSILAAKKIQEYIEKWLIAN